jgi:hypothetical protein
MIRARRRGGIAALPMNLVVEAFYLRVDREMVGDGQGPAVTFAQSAGLGRDVVDLATGLFGLLLRQSPLGQVAVDPGGQLI